MLSATGATPHALSCYYTLRLRRMRSRWQLASQQLEQITATNKQCVQIDLSYDSLSGRMFMLQMLHPSARALLLTAGWQLGMRS